MATAEQKKTITKKRLQELRNQCRDHYNVVADGVLPDGADVRVTMGCLLYTSPSPRDNKASRMPSSA